MKHNHMYDVQRCKPSDYPSTAKAKNKCVEITPTFIDVIQLCMFSERERASVVCWVVDVLGLCKLVCYVCFGVYVYMYICVFVYMPYILICA